VSAEGDEEDDESGRAGGDESFRLNGEKQEAPIGRERIQKELKRAEIMMVRHSFPIDSFETRLRLLPFFSLSSRPPTLTLCSSLSSFYSVCTFLGLPSTNFSHARRPLRHGTLPLSGTLRPPSSHRPHARRRQYRHGDGRICGRVGGGGLWAGESTNCLLSLTQKRGEKETRR